MSPMSKHLILSLAMLSLFLVFPGYSATMSDTGNALVIFLIASSGILLSRMFVLSSSSMDRTGIEPAIIAFIASWNTSFPIYPAVALFTAAGSVINSIRRERNSGSTVTSAIYQGVSFAVFLRLAVYLHTALSAFITVESAVSIYAELILTAMVITLFRALSVCFTENRWAHFLHDLQRNAVSNGFILLLAVPGTFAAVEQPNTIHMLIRVFLSMMGMLGLHGISLAINRSDHESTGELETVLKLREFSRSLFRAGTEMEVLRKLCRALSEAWGCSAAVTWKQMELFEGGGWDRGNGVSCTHPEGLTVSVDSFSSTLGEYLQTFADRAVPVLTALEMERSTEKASWRSMETMVTFLEGNISEFAGFSRNVADTCEGLSRKLGRDEWFRNCLRLAGLLHGIEMPEKGPDGEIDEYVLALPEITRTALMNAGEHWRGTGKKELEEEQIPLPGRILALCIGWEKASLSGTASAIRDINMKAGTLYDPELVEQLLEMKS